MNNKPNSARHDVQPRLRTRGFTLLEVAVALAILGWVLGSAIALVSQYADERRLLRERFLGNQVAWNQLLEEYRRSRGWLGRISQPQRQQGEVRQAGQDWRFATEMEPAAGSGLLRYQVSVREAEGERVVANLALYLSTTGRAEP